MVIDISLDGHRRMTWQKDGTWLYIVPTYNIRTHSAVHIDTPFELVDRCELTMSAPVYGPPLPPFFTFARRRRTLSSNNKLLVCFLAARVMVYLEALEETATDSYYRGRIRSRFRSMYFDRHAAFLDAEFLIIFRMSRRSMEALRHELYPFLMAHLTEEQIEGRSNGNRRPLTVDEKVAIGLMTAGGCPLGGILWGFSIGKTCAILTIRRFFEAVVMSRVGEIKFPSTLREMQAASDAYLRRRSFNPLFYGHIGALDGLAVRIPVPRSSDTDHPLSFVTRKGFAALNCQAIVDAHDKCIHLSIITSGSTHDSTAWNCTALSNEWHRNMIADPRTGRQFWLSLDEAYQATMNQLSPWPGTGLISRAPFKDSFNYYFSAGCRNGIERLFGQVYQRWGILWRPIRFPVKRVGIVVMALFQLHNFLKDQGDESNVPDVGTGLGARQAGELLRAVDVTDGYDHDYHNSDTCHTEEVVLRRVRHGNCPIREDITNALESEGLLRPNLGNRTLVAVAGEMVQP